MGQNPDIRPPATLVLPDEAATEALGRALAAVLEAPLAVLLRGMLGAGKTSLARALIRAAGATAGRPVAEVPSPTFTLVQTYTLGPRRVWHFDLYRLTAPEEIVELGWEEALAEIVLVEWPERLGDHLPPDRIEIDLSVEGSGRHARLAGFGRGEAALARLALQGPAGDR
jgi:tRNA threonylcarbamoyladenosine biosynthesis protein TsaE